jgi:CubicO group peptidase (beta-lactamase class C family)
VTDPVTDLTARRLQSLVAREQATRRLPSLVAGIVRDGHLVWSGSHGEQTGGGAPTPDLQYRIGSLTKTMTAVLVLQLRDEGRLDLNDRLDAHLPGIAFGDRTLRDMLAHATGMPSEPAGDWWERSPGSSFEELAAGLDDREAPHAVRATYHYSNVTFGLLGEVVARARGTSWWAQVEQRILTPLGMQRTTFHPQQPAARGYSVHHFAGTLSEEPAQDTGAMAPAGQLWSTIDDLARYAGFLLDGHPDILSPATLAEMRTPQSGTLAAGTGSGYGLGLRLVAGDGGTTRAGHTGSMPGFLAGLFIDPGTRSAAVCLANGTVGLRCEGLPADLLHALEALEPAAPAPWRPVTAVPDQVAEILGVWHWGNTAYGCSWDGAEVVLTQLATGAESHRFRPVGDGSFVGTVGYHHGERLRVVRNADTSINHLVCATFVYTRTPYDQRAPIPGGTPTG